MQRQSVSQTQQQAPTASPLSRGGVLQRKCGCGRQTVAGGECEQCQRKQNAHPHATIKSLPIQTKLSISEPGNVYEQEADRIASQIMQKPIGYSVKSRNFTKSNQGLDSDTRSFMEAALGTDLEQVRVHVDNEAASMSQDLGAQAFTCKNNIYFNFGKYNPNSFEGRRLLAHELVHVIQQTGKKPRQKADFDSETYDAHGKFKSHNQVVSTITKVTNEASTIQTQLELGRSRRGRYIITANGRSQEMSAEQTHIFFSRLLRDLLGRLNTGHEAISDYITYVRFGRRRAVVERGLGGRVIEPEDSGSFLKDFLHEAVATFSDRAAGVEMPGSEIFDTARRHFSEAAHALRLRTYEGYRDVISHAEQFVPAYNSAIRVWNRYLDQTRLGAESVVTNLETTRDVSYIAVGIMATTATGGLGGALITTGTTTTGAVLEQAVEVELGLRDQIDWAGISFDALIVLVLSYLGGRFGNAIAARILRTPTAASLSQQVIHRIVVHIAAGRGASTLHLTARALFDHLRGSEEALTVEQFMDRLATNLTDPRSIFFDIVAGEIGRYSTRRRATSRTSEPEPTPPPRRTSSAAEGSGRGEVSGVHRIPGASSESGSAPASTPSQPRTSSLTSTTTSSTSGSSSGRRSPSTSTRLPRRSTVTDSGELSRSRGSSSSPDSPRAELSPAFEEGGAARQLQHGAEPISPPEVQLPVSDPSTSSTPSPPSQGTLPSSAPGAAAISGVVQQLHPRRRCPLPTGHRENDPIPMIWYKPRRLYESPITLEHEKYRLDGPKLLPDGSERIGINPIFMPREGKLLLRRSTPRGGVEEEFKDDLDGFGFNWYGYSPDHVQDLFWAGADHFMNLWPLRTRWNSDAGFDQNVRQRVDYCYRYDSPVINRSRLIHEPTLEGRWFVISGCKDVGSGATVECSSQ